MRKNAEAAGLVKQRSVAQRVHRKAPGRSSAPAGSSAAVTNGSSSDATWLLTVIRAYPSTAGNVWMIACGCQSFFQPCHHTGAHSQEKHLQIAWHCGPTDCCMQIEKTCSSRLKSTCPFGLSRALRMMLAPCTDVLLSAPMNTFATVPTAASVMACKCFESQRLVWLSHGTGQSWCARTYALLNCI